MHLDDQQAVSLLEALVRIPSVSRQEAAVACLAAERMKACGFDASVDKAGNAKGTLGNGPRELLLLGHIDTVPGEIPVRREGDQLYGRGSVDAKGPFAAFIAAASRIGTVPGWRITVVGAVEEEAATSCGARHLLKTHCPPDLVVIGEPSGWQNVTLGYKGRLLLDYELVRGMTHGAGQEETAAERAVGFWQNVQHWCDEQNDGLAKVFDRLMPSLRAISAGVEDVHDIARMTVSLRLPPGFDRDAFALLIERWATAGALVDLRAYEPAYRASSRSVLASAFRAAIRAQGVKPGIVVKTGTSDMNVVGPVWKCPILAYGPGDSSLDHTPDEHIDLNEFTRAIAVLEDAISRLCGI